MQTGGQAAGNPPANPQPQGRSIDDATYERFQRYEQQLKGQAPLIDAITKLGIKGPEDLAPLSAIREKGIDFRRLSDAFASPKDEDPEPQIDVKKLIADETGKLRREFAEREYRSSLDAESKRLDALVEELAGEGATSWDKRAIKAVLQEEIWNGAKGYDEGHPLHGGPYRQVYGDGEFKSLAEKVRAEREKAKGEGMNAIAKAASKPSPKPTAGNQGNQGKPEVSEPSSSEDRRARTRETIQRVFGETG